MATGLPIQGVAIVVRGDMNPPIFQPTWFALQNLIRPQEAEEAKVQIIHPDASIFTSDWLQIHVTRDRFQASTSQEPYYEALRDLTVGVFALLKHTPLRAIGLNRDFHYRLDSNERRDYLGHRLAPIGDWGKLLNVPGMLSLTMQGKRAGDFEGTVNVRVEPSTQLENGIYVHINDHYQLDPAIKSEMAADTAVRILTEKWTESMDRGLRISQAIVGLGDSYDDRNR